ncbi:DUF2163 domain-containing protein [Parerythrobacter lacustris]|uniref:DUF2163 domain-containing protein n=1 Tax=Parerythrobacter lacustris TaxID=2969984 RepID=A0ABT1XRI2_9SPHN|nr:DUF2163 domain-containing protein [Parerythrobacter lacustris]MCR2834265.1 DUF2163 domain-containing protein [Parerythrobacter lacustris]
MSQIYFASELEGVATFWRIYRRDGVTLGFTSHDRDLAFDGIVHRAAPGMVPGAIRRSSGVSDDAMDAEGALTHDSISSGDLRAGRYDGARIAIGAVDWESLDAAVLYAGSIGAIRQEGGSFAIELRSAKAAFERDFVPRTGPSCRARFCGPGCTLSAAFHTVSATLLGCDTDRGAFAFDLVQPSDYAWGELVWLDGPLAGQRLDIGGVSEGELLLDYPLAEPPSPGTRARLRQGCDHTLATCSDRFGNAINFQGEPFLPGNDLLARYPLPQ